MDDVGRRNPGSPKQTKGTETFSTLRFLRYLLSNHEDQLDRNTNRFRYGLGCASNQSINRCENSGETLVTWLPPMMLHSSTAPPGGEVV